MRVCESCPSTEITEQTGQARRAPQLSQMLIYSEQHSKKKKKQKVIFRSFETSSAL